MATNKTKRTTFEKSSGNVFADLGLANPEREQLKAHLTLQIYRIVKERGLTQAEAGRVLGIKQPHVSALMRNRSGDFSVERLMDFLIALGRTFKSRCGRHAESMVIFRLCSVEVRLSSTITNADLNRVLKEPQYTPLPTLSVRLASVINCNTRHAGQIEYLRGLVKFKGWFPAAEK